MSETKFGWLKQRLISVMLIGLVSWQSDFVFAWGNEGHIYINRVAAQKIPASMPAFLRTPRAVNEIAYLGPEPDRWRSPSEFALKNSQEPDHFIDMERVSWLDPLPPGRYEFYRKLYEKRAAEHSDDYLPERVGLQPYITMEVYGRLKAAFREYRQLVKAHQPTQQVQEAIIFYAGWLGHYVADASQPLHTTIHYNGWVGENPKGYTTEHHIHGQFESAYVAANLTAKDFSGFVKAPERLDDPFARYVAYLRDSNSLVENVYSLEKAGGLTGKGSPEAFDFTTRRLAAGAQVLLDLWYTAWLESAQPIPEHAQPAPPTK